MAVTTQLKSVRHTYATEFGNVATAVESLTQAMRAATTQEAGARVGVLTSVHEAACVLAEMAETLADETGKELTGIERAGYDACNLVSGRPKAGGEVIDMQTRRRYRETFVFGAGLNDGGDAA